MLKLNASFSKKVPVPGQEYSSKGYSAEISIELPDNLNQQQLQERIHNTFALVESSVESELQKDSVFSNTQMPPQGFAKQLPPSVPVLPQPPAQTKQRAVAISAKQLKYVNDLMHKYKFDPALFLQQIGLNSIYELSKTQTSQLIDLIKNQSKVA
jgi:hypothetical protein